MYSKKATTSTTAVLHEDVILEIVVRLPLKCAIRCMVLNKSLFHLISQRNKALLSSAYPGIEGSIISRYSDDTFKRNIPGSSKILSITIADDNPMNPKILDSCNGVLLLKFQNPSRFCVFNPITSESMFVNPRIKFSDEDILALVVDLDAQTTFQFKLVVAETLFHYKEEEETTWRFTLLVPSGGTSWLIKSSVEFVCSDHYCCCTQVVYVHGCVYYNDAKYRMFVFDVEKEKARSIDWPQGVDAFLYASSDGSLQCISTITDEFEIHSYDQVKNVWQMKHKITNIVSSPEVLFCNEQRVLIVDNPPVVLRKQGEKVVFHMYDVLSDKWEKISPEDLSFNHYRSNTYFSFMPTLAKVSDKYLHDPDFDFEEIYLRGLQYLIMHEARDAKEE